MKNPILSPSTPGCILSQSHLPPRHWSCRKEQEQGGNPLWTKYFINKPWGFQAGRRGDVLGDAYEEESWWEGEEPKEAEVSLLVHI